VLFLWARGRISIHEMIPMKNSKQQKPILHMPDKIIPGRKPDTAYWQALGKFVETYATVEAMMFYVLSLHSKVPADIAKALFSGTRLDASIKYLRRIFAVRDIDEAISKELEMIFTQLIVINAARNDVTHYGSLETLDFGRVSSNYVRAHLPENITIRPMNTEVLTAMTRDLERISSLLFVHTILPEKNRAAERANLWDQGGVWLYKPPPDHEMKLNKPERSVRSHSPRQKDQRHSSRQ
jgi:hypothetical protein